MRRILILVMFCSFVNPNVDANTDKQNAISSQIQIKHIAPFKYLFKFPNSNKRFIQLHFIEKRFIFEEMSKADSFVFTNFGKYTSRMCGSFTFTVFDKTKSKIELKTKGRICCN